MFEFIPEEDSPVAFLLHSFCATALPLTILFAAGISLSSLGLPEEPSWLVNQMGNSLFGPPLYVGPLLLGVVMGRLINGTLEDSETGWVWVVPAALWAASGGPIYDWLGWNCDKCLHQFFVSMPFYASAGYSVGASYGRRVAERARLAY